MNKIRETFLKKYGVGEYILLLVGLGLLGRLTHDFIVISWEAMTWDVIAKMTLFLAIGGLLVAKPMSTLDFFRKRLGVETKE